MTWTPPPDGTAPEPQWYTSYGPLCASKCPWYSSECEHPHKPDEDEDVCIPVVIQMRRELDCARARAEAWHKAAKRQRATCKGIARMLKIVTLADERDLDCARRRAEAWHHAARKWRRLEQYAFDILSRIEPASERQAQAAIATAAREFVRLYGDGGVSKGETREMLAALDRLREVVGGER
jgi:hypothetical protein